MEKNVIGLPPNRFKKGGPPRQPSYKKCDGEQAEPLTLDDVIPAGAFPLSAREFDALGTDGPGLPDPTGQDYIG